MMVTSSELADEGVDRSGVDLRPARLTKRPRRPDELCWSSASSSSASSSTNSTLWKFSRLLNTNLTLVPLIARPILTGQ